MTIKNKKQGTNTIAYRNGASIQRAIIPAGGSVNLTDLLDLSQVINRQDFNRGWFEVISEINVTTTKIEKEKTSLDKAKKEVEEYTEEDYTDTKDKKIKNNKK